VRELKILKPIAKLENAAFLDPIANAAKKIVLSVVKPRGLEDLLHGVPAGHPIHPVLILLPAGAWSSVAVLDVVPGMGKAARLLVGVGVASAIPTAITGWADWSRLHPQQLRVGLVHATSNIVAVALYTESYRARGRGEVLKGKALAYLGYAAVGFGGYLGGHLAYRLASGANHAEQVPHLFPSGWQPVGPLALLQEGVLQRKDVAGQPVLLFRRGERVHALSNVCSHLAGPLDEGELVQEDGEACVSCPWHQSVFSLESGEVVHGPATTPQPRFETRVVAGELEVRLPNAG
jgi:nitrite reductase/ring-hydroxylating ferredoxin subunit